MRLLLALLLALALPSLAAADPPDQGIVHVPIAPGTPLKKAGAELYAANCARCHGDRGHGTAKDGPKLDDVGALATDFYLSIGAMPIADPHQQPVRTRVLLTAYERQALVSYVSSLGPGPLIPHPHAGRGNVSAGMQLFTQHCAGCHQIAAEGGYVTGARVPPLGQATDTQIAEAVRMGPYLMPVFSGKQITNAQLDSLTAYIHTTRHPLDAGGWSIGHVGPIPEGLVTWLLAAVVLVGVCLLIGKRLRRE